MALHYLLIHESNLFLPPIVYALHVQSEKVTLFHSAVKTYSPDFFSLQIFKLFNKKLMQFVKTLNIMILNVFAFKKHWALASPVFMKQKDYLIPKSPM